MNTETNGALIQLTFIDALSFFEAMAEKVGHGYGVESVVYKHGFHILMEYSREAYDENGYHVGTEIATFQWPLFPKRLMGISNVAYNLSEFVVLREQYICKGVKHPRVPRVTKYYFPADCDFYYSEMDFFLENELRNFPAPEFDSETKVWKIGGFSWQVGNGPLFEKGDTFSV